MFDKRNNNYKKAEIKKSSGRKVGQEMKKDCRKERSDGWSTYKAMIRDGLIDTNA